MAEFYTDGFLPYRQRRSLGEQPANNGRRASFAVGVAASMSTVAVDVGFGRQASNVRDCRRRLVRRARVAPKVGLPKPYLCIRQNRRLRYFIFLDRFLNFGKNKRK
jgi:hypothetical protein